MGEKVNPKTGMLKNRVYDTVPPMTVYIPSGSSTGEIVVKRSRFIAQAEYTSSPNEAKSLIERRRAEHPGCSHVVHAFVVGSPNSQTMGLSDDGEPKGTAGRPVLEIIKGSNITNIGITVVRYFGGTKLGTGGLVRAYSDAAKLAIKRLKTEKFLEKRSYTIIVPYELHEPVRRAVHRSNGMVKDEIFDTTIHMICEIPVSMLKDFQDELFTVSKGSLSINL